MSIKSKVHGEAALPKALADLVAELKVHKASPAPVALSDGLRAAAYRVQRRNRSAYGTSARALYFTAAW